MPVGGGMTLLDLASWLAPAATMIAAIMTASNAGTRMTGWGFVLFTVGALSWCAVALATGQQNLLWSNGFLVIVDAIGICRWLGRRAKLEDGARAAAMKSRRRHVPLFPVFALQDAPLKGPDGRELARIAGAMGDCRSGRIDYLVLRGGGLAEGEGFRALAWKEVRCRDDFETRLTREQIAALPPVDPADWPASAYA